MLVTADRRDRQIFVILQKIKVTAPINKLAAAQLGQPVLEDLQDLKEIVEMRADLDMMVNQEEWVLQV